MICLKCCWKSEAVVQLSSVKLRFCKTSNISQKHLRWSPLFRKIVSPQGCNCTKEDTITGVFLWICSCECIFSFLLFFRKDKSSHRRFSVKKRVPKSFENFTGKTPVLEGRFFKNTYFEERLWTTASNQCLFDIQIKLFNNNVNKKKKHVRYLTSKSCDTRTVGDRRLF